MKIFTLFSILLFCFLSSNAQTKDISELEKKGNIYYFDDAPFTGNCYGKHSNGQLGLKGKLADGKKEGMWTWWYSDGTKKRESNYVANSKEGLTTYWHSNGVKAKEIMYRDDKNIDQKLWNEDGTRKPNPTFQQSY